MKSLAELFQPFTSPLPCIRYTYARNRSNYSLPSGPLLAFCQTEVVQVALATFSHRLQLLCMTLPIAYVSVLRKIMARKTAFALKQLFLPADDKIDRFWLGLDGCFGETKLVSRPQFIPKEATSVNHLITGFEARLSCISTTIDSLQNQNCCLIFSHRGYT